MGQASGREAAGTRSEKSGKSEKKEVFEYCYGTIQWTEVPDDVIVEVLMRVPAKDIVKSCVYVCKQWNDVINTQSFWKEKCIKDIAYPNKLFQILVDEDFKKLYFKRPFFTNLIMNPDARDGLDCWKITENGGDRWKVEIPVGCNPLEEYIGTEQSKQKKSIIVMGQASGREAAGTRSEKSGKSEKKEVFEYCYGTIQWTEVPDDVIVEVLMRVPAKDIVKSCVYVCKQWNDVINTQSFWKEKCIKDIAYPNKLFQILVDEDFKKLYFKRPFFTNLIMNPDARDGLDCWKITENGGDRWKVEIPVGCNPLEEYIGTEQSKQKKSIIVMGQASGREAAGTRSEKSGKSEKKEVFEYCYGTIQWTEVPDDVIVEVLMRVPAKDIVKSCVYVCKQWNDVINTQSFWKEKCIKDIAYPNKLFQILVDEDFKKLYFKRPFFTNLIMNPDARDGLDCWKITENGGDRWKVEIPVGCNPLEEYIGTEQSKRTRCWVTSYHSCSKSQTIHLMERGCSKHVLDDLRPDIHVSEWYAARFDCGIEYCIKVQLLRNKDDKDAVKEWTFEDTQPAGRDWFKAEHTFTDYEPGVRYIRYFHKGQDTQFWAGWYGAKITLSSVILEPKLTSNHTNN